MKATSGFSADYLLLIEFYERAGRTEVDRFAQRRPPNSKRLPERLEKGAVLGKKIVRTEPQLKSVALQTSCVMIGRVLAAVVGQGEPSWSGCRSYTLPSLRELGKVS